jgi:hypothetical protein
MAFDLLNWFDKRFTFHVSFQMDFSEYLLQSHETQRPLTTQRSLRKRVCGGCMAVDLLNWFDKRFTFHVSFQMDFSEYLLQSHETQRPQR